MKTPLAPPIFVYATVLWLLTSASLLQGQATSWQDLVDQINNPASSPEPTYTPEEQAAIDAAQAAANAAYEAQVAAFWAEVDAALVSPAPLSTADAQTYQAAQSAWLSARAQRSAAPEAESQANAVVTQQRAAQFGWPMDYTDSDGRLHALVGVESNGLPSYQTSTNAIAAQTIRTDSLLPGGWTGLNLTGISRTIYQWDEGRVRSTHRELTGRAFNFDFENTFLSQHSTWVAGVLAAGGVAPTARGMAPQALVVAYDFFGNPGELNESPEVRTEATQGMELSNHSYGFLQGWSLRNGITVQGDIPIPREGGGTFTLRPNTIYYRWIGLIDLDANHSHNFGLYEKKAVEVDRNAHDFPYHLQVWSAGNQHEGNYPLASSTGYITFNQSGPLYSFVARPINGMAKGGWETISDGGLAKNVLSVGAVDDIPGGPTGPASVTSLNTNFSSRGPTDDGRIKPDIVANGHQLYTSSATSDNTYDQSAVTGTSFAAPSVTGSIGLLAEYYDSRAAVALGQQPGTRHPLLSSTWRAIAIHSAIEAGPTAGPDYRYGWGLMHTENCLVAILANFLTGKHQAIKEVKLEENSTITFAVQATGSNFPLTVTLAWTDPAGSARDYVVDDRTPVLVNDLDLRVTEEGVTHLPWKLDVLNPSFPATMGDNTVDNVEQVKIMNPVAGRTYTITVSHKGELAANQQWCSIIVTGQQLNPQPAFRVRQVAVNGEGKMALLWPAIVGQSDQVQMGPTEALSNPTLWQNVGPVISANREQLSTLHDAPAGQSAYYYRVVEVPNQAFPWPSASY